MRLFSVVEPIKSGYRSTSDNRITWANLCPNVYALSTLGNKLNWRFGARQN